jgi:hypothetical protein
MTATIFTIATLLLMTIALGLLLARRLWGLTLPTLIFGLLAIVAEGPRAAAEIWGIRVPGIIVATQESLKVETFRSSGSRTSHYAVQHHFGAIVCYRATGNPGLGAGAPIDTAIKMAIGEPETAADRLCKEAPGNDVLRQTEIRLDEASHDSTIIGRPVTLVLLRPFGLLEWAWPEDAPLLPMLVRPNFGDDGPRHPVMAEIVSISVDTFGRSLLTRRGADFAVPVAYVRLRYVLAGHPAPLEGIDTVDAASVANLAAGGRVAVTVADGAPRRPMLAQASRTYWWRNPASDLAILGVVILGIVGLVVFIRRRRRNRSAA